MNCKADFSFQRQRVEVRIKANIWVAGIIVSTLQFIQNVRCSFLLGAEC